MTECSYEVAPWPVRDDILAAHRRAWERLTAAGTWLTGAERVAIMAEARRAPLCGLCRRRKEALSPSAEEGAHDDMGALPAAMVEAVHRIRTDPGRLTRDWYQGLIADDMMAEQFVELVGVVASTVAVDQFRAGLGLAPPALPVPRPGAPSRRRPEGLVEGLAWVPLLPPGNATGPEADLYAGATGAHIRQAMSLVPDEVRGFFDLVRSQYIAPEAMNDFANEYRAITHAQIELIAGRVSALNQCVY